MDNMRIKETCSIKQHKIQFQNARKNVAIEEIVLPLHTKRMQGMKTAIFMVTDLTPTEPEEKIPNATSCPRV